MAKPRQLASRPPAELAVPSSIQLDVSQLDAPADETSDNQWHGSGAVTSDLRSTVSDGTLKASNAAELELGRRYVAGEASLEELSKVLGMDRPSVLLWLDERALGRPLRLIRLSQAQRRQALERLVAKMPRSTGDAEGLEAVDRDVLSSQRIEGIDARPWIPTRRA